MLLFLLTIMYVVGDSNVYTYNSNVCESVGSLKGAILMLKTVTSAMNEMVDSAKFQATPIENHFLYQKDSSKTPKETSEKAEHDCSALKRKGVTTSGIYRIWPRFLDHSINVYCDMDTDEGGWIVIQRRGNFTEEPINFFESWEQYKNGFGDLKKEFWLGNDIIFVLTNQAPAILRIDLEDFDGEKRYAKYQNFLVRSEIEKYRMTLGDYEGNAGDSMRTHDNRTFGTKDRGSNCALDYKGGWWYSACHEANLNGLYHQGPHSSYADGINWYQFRGYNNSMRVSEMKIRSCQC